MRQLATIRTIDNLQPIEGADFIECAVIGGWNVVVKKGDHYVGQLVVYLEIDSWVPEHLAPFLGNGGSPARESEGVVGFRLKSKKLRGVVSQGLVLPLSVIDPIADGVALEDAYVMFEVGQDVTDLLNIKKYEKPVSAHLAGMARGNFPSFIPKTDQERVQNIKRDLQKYVEDELSFECTEKLDGSSCTIYKYSPLLEDGKDALGVCSRNIDLKDTEGNTFWQVAKANDVHAILLRDGRNLAIQGEVIGPGIQGNQYKLDSHQFYVFDIFDIDRQCYFTPSERREFCAENGLRHVPILFINIELVSDIVAMIDSADGKSRLNDSIREGYVVKCNTDPSISFKAISNKWLLKYDS
jgi:RNA ligase (TIGR02306 family)